MHSVISHDQYRQWPKIQYDKRFARVCILHCIEFIWLPRMPSVQCLLLKVGAAFCSQKIKYNWSGPNLTHCPVRTSAENRDNCFYNASSGQKKTFWAQMNRNAIQWKRNLIWKQLRKYLTIRIVPTLDYIKQNWNVLLNCKIWLVILHKGVTKKK